MTVQDPQLILKRTYTETSAPPSLPLPKKTTPSQARRECAHPEKSHLPRIRKGKHLLFVVMLDVYPQDWKINLRSRLIAPIILDACMHKIDKGKYLEQAMAIESTKIETQLPNTQGKAEIRPMRLWAEYPGKLHLPAYKVQFQTS